jgi:signal transduction histidine kinase
VNQVAELKAKTESLTLMSSTVNHEMLTPIKCIIQITNILKAVEAQDFEKQKKYLNTISETCELLVG